MLQNERNQLKSLWGMSFGMLFLIMAMCSCSTEQGGTISSPANQVSTISYSETGPHGPSELLVIDFEKNEITYEISGTPWKVSAEDEYYNKYRYNAKEAAEVVRKWQTFDFSKWKDRYDEPGICDGTFWRMKITYKDGTERELSGANKWPEDYNGFGIKRDCWEKVK